MENLSLLFQGDSLTDCGRNKNIKAPNDGLGSGYVNNIAAKILFEHPKAEIYNRGVFGNRIVDMYARWEEDALNIPFNVISILNGVNDVGFGIRKNCGANAKKFKEIYDRIIYETKERKPDADIILNEPFLIKRVYEPENDIFENWELWSEEIKKRAAAVRELAEEYGAVFAEYSTAFEKALKRAPAEHWSIDCIHTTVAGSELMARTWLEKAEPVLKKYF